jgi:hypothetical protein
VPPNRQNLKYLSTKRDKLGHLFGDFDDAALDRVGESCGCRGEKKTKGDCDGR